MGKWSQAQRRYAASSKGKEARRKYQMSEKGRASRRTYLERRKTKLAELKQEPAEEVKPVANEPKVDKIKKEARLKK